MATIMHFFRNLMDNGGPMFYIILFFLLVALVVFAERFLYLHRARIDTFELLRGLMNQLRNHNIKEAIVNCDGRTGPVGEIFRTAIEHWRDGEQGIRYAVEEVVRLLIPRLERNLKLLSGLANMTPVLGLLGTLFSLIKIFAVMATDNSKITGVANVSGDISRALVCTAAGLIASLLCQLFHAVLTEIIDRQLAEMGKGAAEITYFLTTTPPPKN
jgi:biopolymer transport protein ExbB